MSPEDAIASIESEWEIPNGFLGGLREGRFDVEGFARLEALLASIPAPDAESLDRRLVAVTWFIPMFMLWQQERVVERGGDAESVRSAADRVTCLLMDGYLGAP